MDIKEYIKEKIAVIKGVYDTIRVIDPNKKIVIYDNDEVNLIESKCYCMWQKDKECEKCISQKSYEENRPIVMLRCFKGKVFLMIATPLIYNNYTYIVELINDITNDSIIYDFGGDGESYIGEFLANIVDLSTKDGLTGVYNRRYISERLSKDITNSKNNNLYTSVIMADIDLFKEINDTYGHVIGDKVLKDFTNVVLSCIRTNKDWIGRYGGEEFIIVLNNTEISKAIKIVERIKNRLNSTGFIYGDHEVKITCSFGVHSGLLQECSIDEIISKADEKLYKAKQLGRNRIVVD